MVIPSYPGLKDLFVVFSEFQFPKILPLPRIDHSILRKKVSYLVISQDANPAKFYVVLFIVIYLLLCPFHLNMQLMEILFSLMSIVCQVTQEFLFSPCA